MKKERFAKENEREKPQSDVLLRPVETLI